MNGAPPPSRPATPPARPAAPPVGGPAPVAAPPVQAAPVAQAAVAQPPVNAPASVAAVQAVAQTQAPGAPAGAAVATTEKEKKPRKPRVDPNLPLYHGLFVYVTDASGQVVAAMDEKKNDDGTVTMVPRRQQLASVPGLISADNPNGYDPDKMAPLVPNHFKKRGDFYRFQSQLYLLKAAKADAAPERTGASRGGISKNALQLMDLLLSQMGGDREKFITALSSMPDGAKMVAEAQKKFAAQAAAPAA